MGFASTSKILSQQHLFPVSENVGMEQGEREDCLLWNTVTRPHAWHFIYINFMKSSQEPCESYLIDEETQV